MLCETTRHFPDLYGWWSSKHVNVLTCQPILPPFPRKPLGESLLLGIFGWNFGAVLEAKLSMVNAQVRGFSGAKCTPDLLKPDTQNIPWVVPLPRMPVTTRIITFLVGNPNLNLHLPLLLGRGTTQNIADRSRFVVLDIRTQETGMGSAPTSDDENDDGLWLSYRCLVVEIDFGLCVCLMDINDKWYLISISISIYIYIYISYLAGRWLKKCWVPIRTIKLGHL